MRSEEEIRAGVKTCQKKWFEVRRKRFNTKDLNASCWQMDLDFYSAGEYWLMWVLNDKGEK